MRSIRLRDPPQPTKGTRMTTDFKPAPPAPADHIRNHYVGARAVIELNKMQVNVTCLDVRNRYGNLDIKITPMNGLGTAWVSAHRLERVGV